MIPVGLIESYTRIRSRLLEEFPELADDAEALADTLDGATGAHDAIARLIRKHLEDKAAAKALDDLIETYTARKQRLAHRAESQKEAARKIMEAIGERSIKRPEFSLSLSPSAPRVIITSEADLPPWALRTRTEPDKTMIREALLGGNIVHGATLSNGSETLRVLVK